MKKLLIIASFIIILIAVYFLVTMGSFASGVIDDAATGQYVKWNLSNLKEGDIIFQTSKSSQSRAIQIATKSKYSHVGIIHIIKDKYYVYEAIRKVQLTFLNKWILRGTNHNFVVKRLKNRDKFLTENNLSVILEEEEKFKNKNYDLYFSWSDNQMYCSELVWKIYKSIGVEVGKLQKLKEFDLSSNAVQLKLKERFGDKIPLDEPVISPAAIYNSDLLELVVSN